MQANVRQKEWKWNARKMTLFTAYTERNMEYSVDVPFEFNMCLVEREKIQTKDTHLDCEERISKNNNTQLTTHRFSFRTWSFYLRQELT